MEQEAVKHEPTTIFDDILPVRETKSAYSDFPFSWEEIDNSFRVARRFPATYFRQLQEVRSRAREFTDKYVRPRAVEIDQRVKLDHSYFAWDLMKDACKYRFFSLIIPEAFEGVGGGVLLMAARVEEIAVGCAGVASAIGVHSAGLSCGLLSIDPYILEKYIRGPWKSHTATPSSP